MANTRADRGLYNPRLRTGGTPNTHPYVVTAGQVPIYPGQLVKLTAAGTVSLVTNAQLTNASNSDFVGVSMSHLTTTSTTPSVSGQNATIEVVDDLDNTLWDIQLSHAATSQALIGETIMIVDNNTGNSTFQQARGFGDDAASVTVGVAHVVDFVKDDLNDIDALNPRVTIKFVPSATHYHGAGI